MLDNVKNEDVAADEQISDEQLKEVSGGVDFEKLRQENLDKSKSDSKLEELRRDNLEKS